MIDYIAPQVKDKLHYWNILSNVAKGWEGVEDNITNYILKEDGESEKSYKNRINKLAHFDNFNPVLNGIAGLVFSKPIVIKDETPQQIQNLLNNFDNKNNDISVFIGQMFKKAMIKGLAFCLIDSKTNENIKNRADEIKANIRPYVLHIEPENVTSWKTDEKGLTQVKIREFVEEDDPLNPYATKSIEQYRVLYRGSYEVYRSIDGIDTLIEQGNTNLDEIPLYCLNLDETNFFESNLPFYDLAKLNIVHTCTFTDVMHSSHIANVPMLKLFGFDKDDLDNFVIGANKAIVSSNEDAKAEYLDYDGKGVAVADTLMLKIEKQMGEIGLNVLSEDSGANNITATEIQISTTQKQSKLNKWVHSLEDTFTNIFNGISKFYNINNNGGGISIDADILSTPLTAQEITAYNNMVLNGTISNETLYKLLQSRKNISDDIDFEEEKAKIQADGLLDITNGTN